MGAKPWDVTEMLNVLHNDPTFLKVSLYASEHVGVAFYSYIRFDKRAKVQDLGGRSSTGF